MDGPLPLPLPLPLLRLSGAVAERAQHQAGSDRLCRFRTPIATQWPSFLWSVVRPGPTRNVPSIEGVVPPAVRTRPGTALCVEVIPPVRGLLHS
jgi:hypothetical protein